MKRPAIAAVHLDHFAADLELHAQMCAAAIDHLRITNGPRRTADTLEAMIAAASQTKQDIESHLDEIARGHD